MITQTTTEQAVIRVAARPAPILQYRTSQGASGYALLRGRYARLGVLLTGRPLAVNTALALATGTGPMQRARVLNCREGRSPGEFVVHLLFGDAEPATTLPRAM